VAEQTVPDANYVTGLLNILKQELDGLHKRMNEVERLRYHEDKIALAGQEKASGLELRIGLTAELIENVKAAITTNPAEVTVKNLRIGVEAEKNAAKRSVFWTEYLKHVTSYTPVLDELADAQAGLGLGFLKAAYRPWPKEGRRRRKDESDKDYLSRQNGLKRLWGPPFSVVTLHPLSVYCRPDSGSSRLTELIEHSWKRKRDIYKTGLQPRDSNVKPDPELTAEMVGHPDQQVQPLPQGVTTSDLELTTEYWSSGAYYQIYLGSNQVYNKSNPAVAYFVATGRSSSSKDPDKIGLSVADILRHNEPILNRSLTRMAEALELVVRKRLTIELPEGATEEQEFDADNNPVPKTYKFDPEGATSLPPGAKAIDPFAGAEAAYAAMPFIQLMLQLASIHGVSPIFKGQSPGAAGSGYRDTSLYMMALNQFKHLIKSFEGCITELIKWLEYCLVHYVKQEIWLGNLSLDPEDVDKWPAQVEVSIEPFLPQNVIAEGHFYDYMHKQGHITRKMVLQQGLREKDPIRIEQDRMLEDLQNILKPVLYQDALTRVEIIPAGGNGSVGEGAQGADIQTIIRNNIQSMGTSQPQRGEQQISGLATGGQSRGSPYEPGAPPSSGPPPEEGSV